MMNDYENENFNTYASSPVGVGSPMQDYAPNNLSGVAKIKVVGVGGA